MASHHAVDGLSAVSFVGMWAVMMVPMMLPSLIPMLWRYRESVGLMSAARLNWLTALVGMAYFSIWTALGIVVLPFIGILELLDKHQPMLKDVAPTVGGVVVLIAAIVQFTGWKARHLACCREGNVGGTGISADAGTAWRHGVRLALICAPCCANLMVILLVVGMMDLRAMAAVTAAITAERLMPSGERVARAIGLVAIGIAVLLLVSGSES